MIGFVERFAFDQRFGGGADNRLDRLKAMRDDGWQVTVLIVYRRDERGVERATGEGVIVGARPEAGS